ncbi:MAG TPA: Lsr2 family protein [Ktedonobacteraceae bacterium]|jgi:hypothetical protein|nr:Lsr2 family protein [Ktedonobacteraceae bacterium]
MAEISAKADDLDGTPQWVKTVTTHTFSLDGVDCEIDLHDENAAQMRADFARWINASRVIGDRPAATVRPLAPVAPVTPPRRNVAVTKKAKGKKHHNDPEQLKAERSWLRSQGYTVSPFGKVPMDLHAKWEAHLVSLSKKETGGFAGSPFSSDDHLFSAAGVG